MKNATQKRLIRRKKNQNNSHRKNTILDIIILEHYPTTPLLDLPSQARKFSRNISFRSSSRWTQIICFKEDSTKVLRQTIHGIRYPHYNQKIFPHTFKKLTWIKKELSIWLSREYDDLSLSPSFSGYRIRHN